MNLLIPIINPVLGSIDSNLDEVKKSITEYCDQYKNLVVTEDTIADSKQLVADIRKQKKALDDLRKKIKTEWNKPYVELENKIKELLEQYDEPINLISDQLTEFEEERKAEKRKEISRIYEEIIGESDETPECLLPDRIFNPKWENKTYSLDDIADNMHSILGAFEMGESTIKLMEHKFQEEGLKKYYETGDLQAAVKRMSELQEHENTVNKYNEQILIEAEQPATWDDLLPFGEPTIEYGVKVPASKEQEFKKLMKGYETWQL